MYNFPPAAAFTAFPILNYTPYDKAEAVRLLTETLGYRPYPTKHGENRWTRFFQEYFLPEKFGYDKRLAHLSSLIVSGQMDRDTALAKLAEPPYDPVTIGEDTDFVCKKLELSRAELDTLMAQPCRNARDYPWNHENFQKAERIRNQAVALQGRWDELVEAAEQP